MEKKGNCVFGALPVEARESRMTEAQKKVLGVMFRYSTLDKSQTNGYFFISMAELRKSSSVGTGSLKDSISFFVSEGFIKRKTGTKKGEASEYSLDKKKVLEWCSANKKTDSWKPEKCLTPKRKNGYAKKIAELEGRVRHLELIIKELEQKIANSQTPKIANSELAKNELKSATDTDTDIGPKNKNVLNTYNQELTTGPSCKKDLGLKNKNIPMHFDTYNQELTTGPSCKKDLGLKNKNIPMHFDTYNQELTTGPSCKKDLGNEGLANDGLTKACECDGLGNAWFKGVRDFKTSNLEGPILAGRGEDAAPTVSAVNDESQNKAIYGTFATEGEEVPTEGEKMPQNEKEAYPDEDDAVSTNNDLTKGGNMDPKEERMEGNKAFNDYIGKIDSAIERYKENRDEKERKYVNAFVSLTRKMWERGMVTDKQYKWAVTKEKNMDRIAKAFFIEEKGKAGDGVSAMEYSDEEQAAMESVLAQGAADEETFKKACRYIKECWNGYPAIKLEKFKGFVFRCSLPGCGNEDLFNELKAHILSNFAA